MRAKILKPEPFYVLVFGSRNWTNRALIRRELRQLPLNTVIIHGDNGYDANGRALWKKPDRLAVRGADKLAGAIARELGFKVLRYTPNWDKYGCAAGPIRNGEMARHPPNRAIGFHNDLLKGGGSLDMWLKCLHFKIPVVIVSENES